MIVCHKFDKPIVISEIERVNVSKNQQTFEEAIYSYLLKLCLNKGTDFCRVSFNSILESTELASRNAVTVGMQGLIQKKQIILLLNDENKPEMSKMGTLYRILLPSEIISRKTRDELCIEDIDVDGMNYKIYENYLLNSLKIDTIQQTNENQGCEVTGKESLAQLEKHKSLNVYAVILLIMLCAISLAGVLIASQNNKDKINKYLSIGERNDNEQLKNNEIIIKSIDEKIANKRIVGVQTSKVHNQEQLNSENETGSNKDPKLMAQSVVVNNNNELDNDGNVEKPNTNKDIDNSGRNEQKSLRRGENLDARTNRTVKKDNNKHYKEIEVLPVKGELDKNSSNAAKSTNSKSKTSNGEQNMKQKGEDGSKDGRQGKKQVDISSTGNERNNKQDKNKQPEEQPLNIVE